jgi:hypothetical protein
MLNDVPTPSSDIAAGLTDASAQRQVSPAGDRVWPNQNPPDEGPEELGSMAGSM